MYENEKCVIIPNQILRVASTLVKMRNYKPARNESASETNKNRDGVNSTLSIVPYETFKH